MKILNIDAFAKVTRQISLAGQTYAVEEPSVQQFIDNLKAGELLESETEAPGENVAKNFEQAVEAIHQAIPTLPKSAIGNLKLDAMTAVLQFIRGEMDVESDTAAAQEEGAGAEKKPS